MTVNYQLTASDLASFSADYGRYVPAWLSRLYWGGVLPLLLAGLAITTNIGVAVVFTVLFAAAAMALNHWQGTLTYEGCFSPDNVSVQTLPMVATLSEHGAHFDSEAGHIFYRWQFIRDVSQAGRYIRFTVTPIERQHIPITAFRDDAHLKEFLSVATSYVEAL